MQAKRDDVRALNGCWLVGRKLLRRFGNHSSHHPFPPKLARDADHSRAPRAAMRSSHPRDAC
jgi:hypothetical protein